MGGTSRPEKREGGGVHACYAIANFSARLVRVQALVRQGFAGRFAPKSRLSVHQPGDQGQPGG